MNLVRAVPPVSTPCPASGFGRVPGRRSERHWRRFATVATKTLLGSAGYLVAVIISRVAARLAAALAEEIPHDGRVIGLVGPSGSGRSTLARQVCAVPEVVVSFHRIDWLSLGTPLAAPESLPWPDSPAATDLTRQIVGILPSGREPLDPSLAVMELAEERRGNLLVVDDVRSAEQAALPSRSGCQLLITADESLLPSNAVVVRMEPLERDQSVALMGSEYGLDTPTADRLAARCGDRPLAIVLAGRIFGRACQRNHDQAEASAAVPSGGPHPIGAAVAALAALLPAMTRRHLLVLGVFPSGHDIPLGALRRLWKVSRGEAHLTCAELAATGLIDYRPDDAVIRLHELVQPHLEAPHEEYLASIDPGDGAWWKLPDDPAYLIDGLARHLAAADRTDELNRLVTDLRWACRRMADGGAPAFAADLAAARAAGGETPAVVALARTLRAEAEIFERVRDSRTLAALLASRLDGIPALRRSVASFTLEPPYLANRWPPPGRLGPALIRRAQVMYAEHGLSAVVVTPSGGVWTVTADGFHGGTDLARWDPRTGARLRRLVLDTVGHGLLMAADNSWAALLNGSTDSARVILLDAVTGALRGELPGHLMATGSRGKRLAVADHYGQVGVHDTATGARLLLVQAHQGPVTALLIAPDETWLASAGEDGTVRITDARTGGRRRKFAMPQVSGMIVAPGGEWLAAAGPQGVHLIDPVARTHRLLHPGGSVLHALAAAPDGSWLAAAYEGQGALVWDTTDGNLRHTFPSDSPIPKLFTAPDGSWLAVDDRFWDPRTGELVRYLRPPLAVAPDGSWLVVGLNESDIAILDLPLTSVRGEDLTRGDPAVSFALAPDDAWLATGSHERRYWNPVTGQSIPEPAGRIQPAPDPQAPNIPPLISAEHTGRVVDHRALSPDGRWLAVLSHRDDYGPRARQNPQVRVYDLPECRLAASMPAPRIPRGCRWSSDGTALFVLGIGGLHGFTWVQ
jgi:WD40 repeat protein